MMYIKMVLRYAKDRGYLGDKPVPSYTSKLATKRIRPDSTIGDFGQPKDALVTWRDAANSEPRKAARQTLHGYVMVLALSGMRVGEANALKIRTCRKSKTTSAVRTSNSMLGERQVREPSFHDL